MGRPRKYGSDAERQRAWRRRQEEEMVRVNRGSLERLEARLSRLQEVVGEAAEAGDGAARACQGISVPMVLEKLIRYFEERAEESRAEQGAEGQHHGCGMKSDFRCEGGI